MCFYPNSLAYRIDFPYVTLQQSERAHGCESDALSPHLRTQSSAWADQKRVTDALGSDHASWNIDESGRSNRQCAARHCDFYDNNGKVIWVSDGYVDRALYPQHQSHFARRDSAGRCRQSWEINVVVNHTASQAVTYWRTVLVVYGL